MEMPEGVAVEATDLYPDVGVSEAGPLPFGGPETGIATAPLLLETVMPARFPTSRSRSGT